MKLNYIFINEYENPEYIQLHMHNCYELVFYNSNGYSTWKKSLDPSFDTLVYMQQEAGAYKQIKFCQNTLILLPPNILHDEKHLTASKTTAIGFYIDESDKLEIDRNEPLVFNTKNEEIPKFIKRIQKEYAQQSPLFEKLIELLLKRILILLFSNNPTNNEDMINFTKSYIDEHFTMKINFEVLATQIHYSEDHFRVLFKKLVGVSPKAYVLEKRLNYAKKLLAGSTIPLTEISELCGFSDYVQFVKFFKKREGLAPSEYRRLKQTT